MPLYIRIISPYAYAEYSEESRRALKREYARTWPRHAATLVMFFTRRRRVYAAAAFELYTFHR